MLDKQFFSPKQIVQELDKYIIGQKEAKRNVAIALRNRWRRLQTSEQIQKDIVPNNILMIGATGVGKTEIARRLADIANAPFTKVEASKFTEVGYVGRDVESMVRDLMSQGIKMVEDEKKKEIKKKAEETVDERILDILIPPVKKLQVAKPISTGGEANESEMDEYELNNKTRERFKEKLKNRELEDRKVEISVQNAGMPGVGFVGGGVDEVSMMNIQEMISGMMPKKSKSRKVSIKDARKILIEEEMARLIDMEEVKEESIRRVENLGIIFIDEIDKVAGRSQKGSGPDVSREGVQRDLLPIVEGSTVNTKFGMVRTDHILFIAAGAFHVSKPSDLIPELQGRFPIRVELENLTEKDFYRILKTPKNALTKQYKALLEAEGVEINFSDKALEEIARMAFKINEDVENIGARRLHTVMSALLNEIMFEVPDSISSGTKIEITPELVRETLSKMVENKDISQYIL
jgi:ATP-dependent HslUV protease ATP-binding subunit HslU